MYVVVWEFRAAPDRVADFEAAYSSTGVWASVFERGDGYLGTDLLRDASDPLRFVTIDRWASADAYEAFRRDFGDEYAAIDAACEALTTSESLVGRFDRL